MLDNGKGLEEVPHPCVPLLCALFTKGGKRRAFGLPGEGGNHFHCAVSPGHLWCRLVDVSDLFQEPRSRR